MGLLDDKLQVPSLGLAVSRRARVDQLLDHAISGHSVTLVTGPAGAGKTVACASWAAARASGSKVAWLTVDAADRDPARFWRYVAAALSGAGVLDAAEADQLSLAGLAAENVPAQLLSSCGAGAVPAEPAPASATAATLVIDDVHELAGSDVVAGLDELIRHAPACAWCCAGGTLPA